jgi:hypothetical protein
MAFKFVNFSHPVNLYKGITFLNPNYKLKIKKIRIGVFNPLNIKKKKSSK